LVDDQQHQPNAQPLRLEVRGRRHHDARYFPGFSLGFDFRYAVSDTVEFQGFPIPLAFFVLEEGRWVDVIGIPPLGLLNVFLIDSIFLVLLSLAMFVILLRRRSAAGV
jgi:hypothetical protein